MTVTEHISLIDRLAFGRAFIRAVMRQQSVAEVARLCREFAAG